MTLLLRLLAGDLTAQAGDPENTAAVARGMTEFHKRGLDMTHGHQGYGFHGLPLPWGVSADMDAAFRFWGWGHTSNGPT